MEPSTSDFQHPIPNPFLEYTQNVFSGVITPDDLCSDDGVSSGGPSEYSECASDLDDNATCKTGPPAVYSDGRSPVSVGSNKFKKAHPAHHPLGTTEVLTFYPTDEEFKDFRGYIDKIERAGAHLKCGIAKIVPPEGWDPRPNDKLKKYDEVDKFIIENSVEEEIILTEKGCYKKKNVIFAKRKMEGIEFKKMATSSQFKLKADKKVLEDEEMFEYYLKNILVGNPIYGADIEGSFYEPGIEEFNMNHLNTILDETRTNSTIKGVNTVYVYFGMYKTTFPWHAEDMDLYSINFLHFGAPKYWYAVSSENAERFERLMAQKFPYEYDKCKAFLRHKEFIVTPELLREHEIPYGTMVQRPNEFIITFPKGYHMGFNSGYNMAESTNFASDRWIDYGKTAIICKCQKGGVQINMANFMSKYRPKEYDNWHSYWYGNIPPTVLINVPKKSKNKAKRQKLDFDEDLQAVADDFKTSWTPLLKSEDETTQNSQNIISCYDISVALKPCFDTESYLAKFKKDNDTLMSNRVNFSAEKQENEIQAKYWPHCNVCSFFQPRHMQPRCSKVPERSKRLMSSNNFAKTEPKNAADPIEEEDILITCNNCRITVHSSCCSGDVPTENGMWTCFRCRKESSHQVESISCSLCELRGGALIPSQIGNDSGFVHVICCLFNRRAHFNRSIGPSSCSIMPVPKQGVPAIRKNTTLSKQYLAAFESHFSTERYQCAICLNNHEGLTPCLVCYEKSELAENPNIVHVTCGRQVGYYFEIRKNAQDVVMICDRHKNETVLNKGETPLPPKVTINSMVFARLGEDHPWQRGTLIDFCFKKYSVVDFLDGTVSGDLIPTDIVSCECVSCNGTNHQYGSRVRVKWTDGKLYSGYFRGNRETPEYCVRYLDGDTKWYSRSNLMSKPEYSKMVKCQ